MKIRILLVDDQEMFRVLLRRLLRKQPDMEVVAEATDGGMAIELVQELKPDVVVMDVNMPGVNGIEATQWITSHTPDVKVIAFTSDPEIWILKEMFKAGACGYLVKGCKKEELTSAIYAVTAGRSYLSEGISADGLENFVPDLSNVRVD